MRASHLRIALLVLWVAFFCWYTPFGGPLTASPYVLGISP
jgi:hypothetical protein